ncbi:MULTISPECIES: chemotaxis protein CheW [Xanthocytophaga]|uniref:Chemotaxis protein CheW n=2 Tax=Xanthocytophaga TaxID=3078918 RepID=A0AAE3QVD9_9BACT|nr:MULTISPECIES: chemotaxis protein CheW [Xanthocytophaga]MDJ1486162.1 chemotaxis protein CheW [Xanthocytophaga flavus]MDJ1506639.1 chemotaxis protein CheW [Xanthocytophaga agilis]
MSTVPIKRQSYLSFNLGEEKFATNELRVREVLKVTKITIVPDTPPFVRGITNLRGMIMPVIDTRIKCGMVSVPTTQDSCLLVLTITKSNEKQSEFITIGALVDSVIEVFEADQHQIKSLPIINSEYQDKFIQGTFKIGDDFIMYLNIDELFSLDEKENLSHLGLQ